MYSNYGCECALSKREINRNRREINKLDMFSYCLFFVITDITIMTRKINEFCSWIVTEG